MNNQENPVPRGMAEAIISASSESIDLAALGDNLTFSVARNRLIISNNGKVVNDAVVLHPAAAVPNNALELSWSKGRPENRTSTPSDSTSSKVDEGYRGSDSDPRPENRNSTPNDSTSSRVDEGYRGSESDPRPDVPSGQTPQLDSPIKTEKPETVGTSPAAEETAACAVPAGSNVSSLDQTELDNFPPPHPDMLADAKSPNVGSGRVLTNPCLSIPDRRPRALNLSYDDLAALGAFAEASITEADSARMRRIVSVLVTSHYTKVTIQQQSSDVEQPAAIDAAMPVEQNKKENTNRSRHRSGGRGRGGRSRHQSSKS